MEDDIVGKEDESLRGEDDTKEIPVSSMKDDLKEASIAGRQESIHHQVIAGVGHQPPPPILKLVEKSLPIRGILVAGFARGILILREHPM